MTDTLFDIEPVTPRWQELADLHGIKVVASDDGEESKASMSWFNGTAEAVGPTPRDAAVTLIHKLQLSGWQTVAP